MFVDASALVAILAAEDDADSLSARLINAEKLITSPMAIYEAAVGLARARQSSIVDAFEAVSKLLANGDAEIVPITAEIGRAAITALERYGRGRHAAQRNMGDCFAYACAKTLGVPLLYKGDDFTLTDIA
ncbi:MAG: type II toxin-antitoxin system VapC family toxin [Thiohalocapsa sp.]